MILASRDQGATALIGELDAATAPDLDVWAAAAAASDTPVVILDVSALGYLDSAGICALLRLERSLAARTARLVLHNVAPQLQRILLHGGLGTHFTIRRSKPDPAASA